MLSMWLQRICQMGKISQTKSTGLLAGVNNSKWTKAVHKSKNVPPPSESCFQSSVFFQNVVIQINLMFFFCWYKSLVPHFTCVISAILLQFWYFKILQTAFQLNKICFSISYISKDVSVLHTFYIKQVCWEIIYESYARGKESQIIQNIPFWTCSFRRG